MNEQMKSYYEGYFNRFGNELSREAFEISRKRYEHNFDRFVAKLPREAKCLDAGCGIGQFVYYLTAQGMTQVTGIDIHPTMIECARQIVPKAQFVVSGVEEYVADKQGQFDLVVMNDVVEHLAREHVVRVLASIREALRPGGVLLVKTPNMANPFCLNPRYKDLTHLLGFTETSLGQALFEAGFSSSKFYEEEAPVTSWRARLRKRILLRGALGAIRFFYYCLEMSPVPHVLTQWVIARAQK